MKTNELREIVTYFNEIQRNMLFFKKVLFGVSLVNYKPLSDYN